VPASKSGGCAPTLLLDLGGVVLGIDFHRVFQFWAQAAAVEPSRIYDQWRLDQAYKEHEVGKRDFHAYTQHLATTLGISMSQHQWREGWNALWTEPHRQVAALFPQLKKRFHLCAFSNTNAVHAESFLQRYPDVMDHFDHLYLSHEVGFRKPEADAFKQVCALIQTDPSQVVFLDDSEENVEGARAAGLTAFLTRGEAEVLRVLNTL
jgi:HAD superfamily hydrolase (TIGR01509 family)